MRRIRSIALLALLLLPSPAILADPGRFTTLFCPECWTFLAGHGTTDLRGNCAVCGKYPLELEVQTVTWFWCSRQHRWLQEACAENSRLLCCTREDSPGVVTKPGPGLLRAAYCPLHQSFDGSRMPLLEILICAKDGRPMVSAWASCRTWFWCRTESQWVAAPCPLDPVKQCCSRRQGLLLATPEPGPLADE